MKMCWESWNFPHKLEWYIDLPLKHYNSYRNRICYFSVFFACNKNVIYKSIQEMTLKFIFSVFQKYLYLQVEWHSKKWLIFENQGSRTTGFKTSLLNKRLESTFKLEYGLEKIIFQNINCCWIVNLNEQ